MALRGKKPKPKDMRLKLMMYSLAGIGKTTAAIQMPKPYIIDSEVGTVHYEELITKAGGVVFPTTDLSEVIREVKALMVEKHDFRTLVIDSITPPYEAKIMEGADDPNIGDSYGKHIAYADRHMAHLFRLLTNLDMNVIVTAHSRDKWEGGENVGQKPDGWKKLDYIFDLVLELQRRGKERHAMIKKTRLEGFPDQESFLWSFDELTYRWGEHNLTRAAEVVKMATKKQVETLTRKVEALKYDTDGTLNKWLKKADAASTGELTGVQIATAIEYCDKKLAAATNGEGAGKGAAA